MKAPALKKRLLSYVLEQTVEEQQSEISGKLKVSLSQGRYMLSIGDVIYSFEDHYTSFRDSFYKLQPNRRNINSVLVLGYGLGSIPFMLYNRYNINGPYTAVDLDPVVLELAQKYSKLPESVPVNYVAQDAAEFLKETTDTFDMICIDVFVGEKIPKAMRTNEFIKLAVSRLSEKGLLMFNWLNNNEIQQREVLHYYETIFKAHCPEAFYIRTYGNWILVYDKAA